MTKKWPEDPSETVRFEELTQPVRETLEFAYDFQRKNRGKDLPYNGYPHTQEHILPSFDVMFTAEELRYEEEEQNRDALERIISALFLLGYENGQRAAHEREENKRLIQGSKHLIEKIKLEERIERLESRLCSELGYLDTQAMYDAEEDL